MLDRLEALKARFEQLGVALTNPAIVNDNKKFAATSKEYRSLEKIVKAHDEYKRVLDDIEFNREVLNGDDAEMRPLRQRIGQERRPERAKRLEGHYDAPALISRSGPRWKCGSACGRTVFTSAVATIGRKRTNRQNIVKKSPKLPIRHETSHIVGVK